MTNLKELLSIVFIKKGLTPYDDLEVLLKAMEELGMDNYTKEEIMDATSEMIEDHLCYGQVREVPEDFELI